MQLDSQIKYDSVVSFCPPLKSAQNKVFKQEHVSLNQNPAVAGMTDLTVIGQHSSAISLRRLGNLCLGSKIINVIKAP